MGNEQMHAAPGLDRFREYIEVEKGDGLDVSRVPAGKVISFKTLNTQYHFLVTNPATYEGIMVGGEYFQTPQPARINGSKIPKHSMIANGKIQMHLILEIGVDTSISSTGILDTSNIQEIYTSDDKSPFA